MALTEEQKTKLRQHWATPPDFFDAIDSEFDFVLDAAATKNNRKVTAYFGPDHHVTSRDDMFTADISKVDGTIYLNPPFAAMMPIVSLATIWQQQKKTVVVVGPVSPDTAWWRALEFSASEIRFLRPRIKFISPHPELTESSNRSINSLIVFRPKPESGEPIRCRDPFVWNWA